MVYNITKEEIKYLVQQPNSNFERMPAILDCVIGLDIMNIQSINKYDGIVHGITGKLNKIIFDTITN